MRCTLRVSRLFLACVMSAGLDMTECGSANAGMDEQTAMLDLSVALDDLQAGRIQAGLADLEAAETVLLNVRQSENDEVNAMYMRVLHDIDQAHNALVRDDPDPAILLIQSAKAKLENAHEKAGASSGGTGQ